MWFLLTPVQRAMRCGFCAEYSHTKSPAGAHCEPVGSTLRCVTSNGSSPSRSALDRGDIKRCKMGEGQERSGGGGWSGASWGMLWRRSKAGQGSVGWFVTLGSAHRQMRITLRLNV
ncbi:hypothetical protein DPEC_G00377890 [Dallia pectoralis]|nr:hypothetical protein DPEC_G00377890 [Dallia pectoralis]